MVDPTEYAERENNILDAAKKLILHYGYDKTTVSDIAREAAISKGAIYLHFESKDDLVEALIWREAWGYIDQMVENIENDTSPWSFVTMFRSAMEAISRRPLMLAFNRSDEQILGSFLRKRGHKFLALKNSQQLPLVRMMQEKKVIRDDIEAEVIAYLFAIISTGFVYIGTVDVGMPRPEIEAVTLALGDMLERFVTPQGEGNPEAGKQIMLDLIEAFKEQRAAHLQAE